MICERTYLASRVDERDPEETCYACDGAGFKRWHDSTAGALRLPCEACAGVATAGVFVVRIVAGLMQIELNFHTSSITHAIYRAERAAKWATRIKCMGAEPLRMEVIYKPARTRAPDETVEIVVINPRQHVGA